MIVQNEIQNNEAQAQVQNEECLDKTPAVPTAQRPKPAQDKLRGEIQLYESQLNNLYLARDSGVSNETINAEIKQKKKQLEEATKKFKGTKRNAGYQKKARDAKKLKWQEVVEKYPGTKDILKPRESPGQPRLEEEYPTLHSVILEIAKFGSGADERRQTETIRSIKSLDDLKAELIARGFKISR